MGAFHTKELHTIHFDNPDEKRAYNNRLFSIVAPRYAMASRILSLGNDQRWKRALIAILPQTTAPRICDLACGPGDLIRLLQARFIDASILGIDLSADMLARRQEQLTTPRTSFYRADMLRLPLTDNCIDICTGGYALRNAPDIPGTIREINRVLKPGGYAALLEFSRSDNAVVAATYNLVLYLWGALIGLMLHRDHNVYAYLARSVKQLPSRTALRNHFRDNGFTCTVSKIFFLGMIEITLYRKER